MFDEYRTGGESGRPLLPVPGKGDDEADQMHQGVFVIADAGNTNHDILIGNVQITEKSKRVLQNIHPDGRQSLTQSVLA